MKKETLLVCVIVIAILLALLFYTKYGFQKETDENKPVEATTTMLPTSATLPAAAPTVDGTAMPPPPVPPTPAQGGGVYDPILVPLNGEAEK